MPERPDAIIKSNIQNVKKRTKKKNCRENDAMLKSHLFVQFYQFAF